ncbi:MAG TPA: curli-like amyloid fiber formation chaperone CsgH [Burkholderiales bacterium]|nr:curli-like amyloid fiber formation chaperone CsgH [Burkholderiales bacterium]
MKLFPIAFSLAVICTPAIGADAPYELDIGTSLHRGQLKVEPSVHGPAGKVLRYEMKVRRTTQGGSSDSSQSGDVKLDDSGEGQLASSSVNVGANDRYRVTVRVFDENKLVAEKTAQYP